jgi:N-acetylglucosamine malate deacetylase 1
MNILVIAPHPDDEAIGCGGTICLHSARGDRVTAVFLTSGELGLKQVSSETAWAIREREAKVAARILGLAETAFLRLPDWAVGDHLAGGAALLKPILKHEQPDLIFLPHPDDWHPDHRAAWPVLKRALRGVKPSRCPVLRAYEVWTPLATGEEVQDISAVMPRKLRALRAHRSQLEEFDYVSAVQGLNRFRGALSGKCRYAEVFVDLHPSMLRSRSQ